MSCQYVRHFNHRPLFDLIVKTLQDNLGDIRGDVEKNGFWNPNCNDDAISFDKESGTCGFTSGGLGWYKRHEGEGEGYTEISLNDFFALFIKPTSATITLNEKYSAVVNKDGKVTVGCQVFSIKEVQAVLDAHKELNKA